MQRIEAPAELMPARAVWRPPAFAWGLLALAALVLTVKFFPSRLEGHWLFATPVLIVLGVVALRRLWEVDPAVIMSGALACSIFSGAWGQLGLDNLPLDRLLAVFVVCQCLLHAPGTARMPLLRLRGVHLLMLLTVAYAIGSAAAAATLTTEAGFLSLWDELGFMPFLLFLIAPAVFHGQRQRQILLSTLVVLGAYLGLTAIFEILGPHSLVFPHYITVTDVGRPGVLRAGGPFQSAIAEGAATFACAVAAAIAFSRHRHERKRWLIGVAGALAGFGCLLSLERSVWIAATVAVAAAAIATRTGRRWLIPGLIATAILIGAILTVSPALSDKASERASNETSVQDRQNQLAAGWRMVKAEPLLGVGWDRYSSEALDYFRLPADFPMVGYVPGTLIGIPQAPEPLHNAYLSYAVELGLVGALLWLGSLIWAVGEGIFRRGPLSLRPWKLGLIAVALFVLVVTFFNPHEPPFPTLMMLVWAGVALSGVPSRQVQRPATPVFYPRPAPSES
jgi:putative inorganic carbon (HCO3(-)) transporter